jgi:hypothetical protein
VEHTETTNNQQRFICYRMQHIYGNNTNENLLSQRDNGKLRKMTLVIFKQSWIIRGHWK